MPRGSSFGDAIATGAAVPGELSTIQSYAQSHSSVKGMFAVDAGSTQGVAQTIQKQGLKGKVQGGGYDLLKPTEELLQKSGFVPCGAIVVGDLLK